MPTRRAAIIVPRASGNTVPARDIQSVVHAIKERIEALEADKSGNQEVVALRRTVAALQRSSEQVADTLAGGGQQGAPSPIAANIDIEVSAGQESVSASRVVAANANGFVHADHTDLTQAGRVMGFSVDSAQPNEPFLLRIAGTVEHPNWSWSTGAPLYLSTDGNITDTLGVGAFEQFVGVAIGAQAVLIALPHAYEINDAPAGSFQTRDGAVPRQAEAVEEATPSAIARTLPSGQFDHSLIPFNRIVRPAGEQLTAYRVVTTASGSVVHADAATAGHANRIVGVVENAAAIGADARIAFDGELNHVGWSFTPDKAVFVGLNGELTQAPPAAAFLQRVGYARTATDIVIDIGEAVIYAQ